MGVFALILNPVMFGDERFAPFGMIPLDFWTRQVLLWLSTFLFFSLFFFGKKNSCDDTLSFGVCQHYFDLYLGLRDPLLEE